MKDIKNFCRFIREDVLGTDNRYIAFFWIGAVAMILGIGVYLTSESMSFVGVADSRELQINFEYPVEIKRVHVLPGQAVKQGDLLIELNATELNTRLRELQAQIGALRAEMNVRKNLNQILRNKGGDDSSDPLSVQIGDLAEELTLVENQKKNLYIFASVSGIVGAVNFKKGEKAPSFAPLITISSDHPTYVQGFIHESLQTRLEVGRKVSVAAANGAGGKVEGRIVSVGSRIVEMPPQLMYNPHLLMRGREIIVEIPENNGLLLGEKVIIKPRFELMSSGGIGLTMANASEESKQSFGHAQESGIREIAFPSHLAGRFSFEPSGLIYLNDIKKFMVVSDDTDSNRTPYVFLMDIDGQVDDQPLRIPGVEAMNDMESISADGESIYILTSLALGSRNSDRDFPGARNLFVRTRFSGLRFGPTESIQLRPILLNAIRASNDAEIRAAFGFFDESSLEIESHFVADGSLFLGLKSPLSKDGNTVILAVRNLDRVFATKAIAAGDLTLETRIRFSERSTPKNLLTDLAIVEGELYATTRVPKENRGALWKIPQGSSVAVARLVKEFDGYIPEGIAFEPESRQLVVTFDQGSARAAFERVPLEKGSGKNVGHK